MRDRQQGKNERKLSKNKPTHSSKFRTAVRQTATYNQTPVNQSIITINCHYKN